MTTLTVSAYLVFAACAAVAKCAAPPVLQYGRPESVGMDPLPLQELEKNLTGYTQVGHEHPLEPGSASLVARNGFIVSEVAVGRRSLYADANGTLLPEAEQEDATVDTIYDMASCSKLFATITLLREVDAGLVRIEDPVEHYLPQFGYNGKQNVTILHLLTHTSGLLPLPEPQFWFPEYNDSIDAMYDYIMSSELQSPPGTEYVYSDVGLMTIRFLLERVKGVSYDRLVSNWIIPLGLSSTHFNRENLEGPINPWYPRIAPTEFQLEAQGPTEPDRPQPVRGTVHDENTWALGGVSGHAGVFSTLSDMAIFGQMILNNGTYDGFRVVSESSINRLFVNNNRDIASENGYSVGFAINTTSFMGVMASPETIGHTGFTGTSIVIDRPTNTLWVHLSNRVHPSRHWGGNNEVRRAMAYWVAKSLGRNVDG